MSGIWKSQNWDLVPAWRAVPSGPWRPAVLYHLCHRSWGLPISAVPSRHGSPLRGVPPWVSWRQRLLQRTLFLIHHSQSPWHRVRSMDEVSLFHLTSFFFSKRNISRRISICLPMFLFAYLNIILSIKIWAHIHRSPPKTLFSALHDLHAAWSPLLKEHEQNLLLRFLVGKAPLGSSGPELMTSVQDMPL